MGEEVNRSGETYALALPAAMDLTTAAELKQMLLAAVDSAKPIVVDAANVQRITTPCFQVLVAAARDMQKTGGSMKIVNVPDVFREPAQTLGLCEALGLTEV